MAWKQLFVKRNFNGNRHKHIDLDNIECSNLSASVKKAYVTDTVSGIFFHLKSPNILSLT